jgi:hypothetical protein
VVNKASENVENCIYFHAEKILNDGQLSDIYFGVDEDTHDFPEYIVDLKDEIEYFITVIQLLYSDKNSEALYNKYYERLYYIADLAFNSKVEKVKLAERSLVKLKSELISNVGHRIRNKLLIDYVKSAVIPCVIMFGLFLFGDLILSCIFEQLGKDKSEINVSNIGLVSIAAICGGWITTATETKNMLFSDIVSVLNNQKSIIVRLIFINLISVFFSILIISELLTINLGGLDSNNIVNDSTVALAFGFVLGLLDKVFLDRFESKLSKVEVK